ncbi:hypothetical protein LUZ60_005659 [Juncus effusus]|nr:hypothetical protein LUZ60_005659 [Juncus effusus]
MRILNWVGNKFKGWQDKKSCDSVPITNQNASNQDFDHCSQTLLSIGTFGNKHVGNPKSHDGSDGSCSSQNNDDSTLEKLQEELKMLFSLKPKSNGTEKIEEEKTNLQLSKILNYPSELIRASFQKLFDEFEKTGGANISPDMKIILSKAKEILANKSNGIRQKSVSFLLKKVFLCSGGFVPGPNLRDRMPESRMERILRALLHKKIYPQNSTWNSTKKYLGNKDEEKRYQAENEEKKDGCKWVKTDSEYIVLDLEL